MYKFGGKFLKLIKTNHLVSLRTFKIVVSDEVECGLLENKPLVALESTIITHGMPYPDNVRCALDVEAAVRERGAIPATIAIVNGEIKAGLTADEINRLGDTNISKPIKTSRRDLGYVVAGKFNGGTTVSGTLIVANRLKVPIFATGGIGGVHRQGETTFDISADLIELGRSNVAVISSGIKSILDIPKTIEYLETQGVFVATFGHTTDFPAFYSTTSGCHVPYSVPDASAAAQIIHTNLGLDLQSGMLFGVPVPQEFALDHRIISGVIEEALHEAEESGITGKEITPFLLGKIANITKGKSLQTNMALIRNNARTAADVAVKLAKLGAGCNTSGSRNSKAHEIRPVVIGGSNLDCSIKLAEKGDIEMDGRIHFGKFTFSAGGVGRNIADALSKLGCTSLFISALGSDPQGAIMKEMMPKDLLAHINFIETSSTGQCAIVLDSDGDCKFLIGDMEIHKGITPEMIAQKVEAIKKTPLIVFDGNLSLETMDEILSIATSNKIPVFYEPTDLLISEKPFGLKNYNAIKYITPNFNELCHIAKQFGIISQCNNRFEQVVEITSKLINHVENIIVTLGADGLVIARRGSASDPLLNSITSHQKLGIRHYPVDKVENFVNVNGAGDSLASGMIAAMIKGKSEEVCVSVGIAAARKALCCKATVADVMFGHDDPAWVSKAYYKTLL